MSKLISISRSSLARQIAWTVFVILGVGSAQAQVGESQPITYRVSSKSQRLEMIVNTSRILTMDKPSPRLLVNDTNIVQATPLSPNRVQVSAIKPGVTQVNLWDDDENIYTVDVVVTPDARELENLLRTEFPDASLRVRPLSSSVLLTGFVPTPEMVGRVVRLAEDYYPQVINNLEVGGVQQILLHVQIFEVSRSKLRDLGMDWSHNGSGHFLVSGVSGLINSTAAVTGQAAGGNDVVRFGVINNNSFFGFVRALRSKNLSKLLAEPTLTTVSGRPASFNVGGEFPIVVPQSLGTVSIEYREFGTRVDFLPIVLGNGNIRLEVRPEVTERDDAGGVNGVPAVTTRWVDTAVEMKAGQTLALAGLISNRVEAQNSGIPYLADLPMVGAAFRTVRHRVNEIELMILVRPEFCEALDPCQAPTCGPGMFTASPSDKELYCKGYLEVPSCGPCGNPGFGSGSCEHGCACGECAAPGVIVEPAVEMGVPPMTHGGQPLIHQQGRRFSHGQARVENASFDRHDRRDANGNRSNSPRGAQDGDPGLIGPLGYDLLKN